MFVHFGAITAITTSTLRGRLGARYWSISAGICFHSAKRALLEVGP
uniref:Uncharacterized protein n=1 Tax=Anguilla anguilla TaxID=7936 RepID=A0A0E9XFE0_ANGAN